MNQKNVCGNKKRGPEKKPVTFDSHPRFYTEIENVFTTPTTVSEASGDAEEIELEEELLSYCTDKERFLSIVYSLKDQKLEILLPFLKLLHLFKKPSADSTRDLDEETVSDISPIEGNETKPPMFDVIIPKYCDWDFKCSYEELSMEPGAMEKDEDQERLIIEDLLNILLGYDGKNLKANSVKHAAEKRTFQISSQIKPTTRGVIEKILPIASDYSTVVRFINENTKYPAGKVNQALSACFMRELVEYMNYVLNLEYLKLFENLTLHIVWCALQEPMNKLRIIAKIVYYINQENARGASTLNILHRCTSNSLADQEAEKICLKLTKSASSPYFQILENWIYKGVIDDPFDEFMIVKKSVRGKGVLDWDKKFELRPKNVPKFLKTDSSLILNAGRYMYAIRKSVPEYYPVPCAEMETIHYENIELIYLNMIRRAYDFANENLLSILVSDDMINWLRTAKSLFSIEFDDLFYSIVSNCKSELEKPATNIFVPYLQQMISTCIQTSCFRKVPYSSQYTIKLEKRSLKCQMNRLMKPEKKGVVDSPCGLDALTFQTTPPWPACIIFHSKTSAGYQMLFRHIFHMKYVYMQLTSTRLVENPKTCHLLKYSMTVFVQTCLSYMTIDTIQTLWNKFENECRCVDSVGEFIQLHNNCMYQMLSGCMLASPFLFQCLYNTLDICIKFCKIKNVELKNDFNKSLVILIKAASKESYWSPFIKSLIPIYTDIPEVVELNNDYLYYFDK